jgi:hypothetical protein
VSVAARGGRSPHRSAISLRRPTWERLWQEAEWRDLLPAVEQAAGAMPGREPWRSALLTRGAALCDALGTGDRASAIAAATALAGLGEGSTPAGDDYLMGALHALWAADHPARAWAASLAAAAAARTIALSAAWLAAAARGRVAVAWRELLAALAAGDAAAVAAAAAAVRACGHTSGVCSLRGFLDVLAVAARAC